jgi:hypothetical protein
MQNLSEKFHSCHKLKVVFDLFHLFYLQLEPFDNVPFAILLILKYEFVDRNKFKYDHLRAILENILQY